jgi:transcriptional regulator of heat shock response
MQEFSSSKISDKQKRVLFETVELCLANENTCSRNIASRLRFKDREYSPSSIRYELQKLQKLGYLYEPYLSAGKMPTNRGLSWYVDYLQETDDLISERYLKTLSRLMSEEQRMQNKLLHSTANTINRAVFVYDGNFYIRNYRKVFLDKPSFDQNEVIERVNFMENLESIVDMLSQTNFVNGKLFFAENFSFKYSQLTVMVYKPSNRSFVYGTVNPIISDYHHQLVILKAIDKVINQNLLR